MKHGPRYALLSCWDKNGLEVLAPALVDRGFRLLATGGTLDHLRTFVGDAVESVEAFTGSAEILGGRVKTLHPRIHGSILARRDDARVPEGLVRLDVVVVNLYPFWTLGEEFRPEDVELIDIGGVALLRAAAKNHEFVTAVHSPAQYAALAAGDLDAAARRTLAAEAFQLTAEYDARIARRLRGGATGEVCVRTYARHGGLKYGCNPAQSPAALHSIDGGTIPLRLLNGDWGYINVLDAVGCWQLVCDLRRISGLEAACSFKHTSPAGAAIALPVAELPEDIATAARSVFGRELADDPALNAYMRARLGDTRASFGDFVGVSCAVQSELAEFLAGVVSDGIVAPGYTDEALRVLRAKKRGRYVIVQADPGCAFGERVEFREVCGLALSQPRNAQLVEARDLETEGTAAPASAARDLVVANACLKYAQSNTIACARFGQLVSLAAGQQSRIGATQLALHKARVWTRLIRLAAAWLPRLDASKRKHGQHVVNALTSLAEASSLVDLVELTGQSRIAEAFGYEVRLPSIALPALEFHRSLDPLCLASDAFFPFSDCVELAGAAGVRHISQPGGSVRDEEVLQAAQRLGIQMYLTGKRLFTH